MMGDKDYHTRYSIQLIGSALIIFVLTLMVYAPALNNEFINWDDGKYVYQNKNIRSLNFQFLYWMLTSFHESNWHPLTWLSLAIDYAFWELDPLGYHLTNVILHGLNTLLVFFLVIKLSVKAKEDNGISSPSKMGGSTSAKPLIVAGVTALLFSLHPLHVESVAWVAERKDLLCAFFFLLGILFYLSYISAIVKKYRWIWFNSCLLLFICALMSKPMAVTLPVVLLLLDIYPLKRVSLYPNKTSKNLSVLLEKIPFFALSLASSVITIMAQHFGGALATVERFPLTDRLLNALRTLVFYIEKIIFPVGLVPFYPLPKSVHCFDIQYLLSGIIVLIATGFCLWMLKRGKHLFFIAWSYYVVTLLPVLGIIQVGSQASADRYTYLPSLSIFLLLGIGGLWIFERGILIRRKAVLGVVIFMFLCIFMLLGQLTIKQIKIWHSSEIFWSYVISAFPDVQRAHNNLGAVYYEKGRLDEAMEEFERALAINFRHAKAHNNLGLVYTKKGKLDEAITEYKKALSINPDLEEAHANLGYAYGNKGRLDEAISEYKHALAINPHYVEAYNGLGNAYAQKGRLDESITEYNHALDKDPNFALAHNNLGAVYYERGRLNEAITEYKKALIINPNYAEARYNLGLTYEKQGMLDEAITEYKKALIINPNYAEARYSLGLTYEKQGVWDEAISAYKKAFTMNPNYAKAYNNLAWIYATSPLAHIRDSNEAVVLALKACELTDFKEAEALDTLAAAYAEAGNFEKAIEFQERAIDLCQEELKSELLTHLKLYQAGQAYRSQ